MEIDDYYEKEILIKLANKENLTEEEICFMFEAYEEVHRELTDTTRWHICVSSVVKVGEKLFYKINWLKAKNECDKNQFDKQPYRVKKETKPVEVFVRCEN